MIEIGQIKGLDASLNIPGSKYVANRAVAIAALAEGTSVIKNMPDNLDIRQAIACVKEFGAVIKNEKNCFKIKGCGGSLKEPKKEINVLESGTLMRLMLGFACLAKGKTIVTGSSRIKKRPAGPLIKSLQELGARISSNNGFLPAEIQGSRLKGGKTRLPGNISSQFISSLLIISPFAESDVEIELTTELLSKNYVDMTIDIMKKFNVNVERIGYRIFKIKSGQKYKAANIYISPDWSSASYFYTAAAILPGSVKINSLDFDIPQGESKFAELLVKMGCIYRRNSKWLQVIGPDKLNGVNADMSNMPDVVPSLAVAGAFAKGVTKITKIGHLRLKESDRISALASELKKLGIKTIESQDSLTIFGGSPKGNAVIETYNDHRIAMSFAIAGLKLRNIKIKNPSCVNKSFPGFWNKLKQIGSNLKQIT